jgi:murein DD-endopeptidase MepM/ murein hydrolase activator NlpD
LVKKGDRVKQGSSIGLVGDTGNNDKPSLYLELRQQTQALNPVDFFSKEALRKLVKEKKSSGNIVKAVSHSKG